MGARKEEMKEMVLWKVEYTCTRHGYAGVTPPILVANIHREMKGGHIRDGKRYTVEGYLSKEGTRGGKGKGKGMVLHVPLGEQKESGQNKSA
jgi:hypothetical protein